MRLLILLSFILSGYYANAQGCVAIRSNGNTCTMPHPEDQSKWQLNLNDRYFRSYKHFVGKEEQHHRLDSGTNVINYVNALDITLTKRMSNRWSGSIGIPIISNKRTSLYEHYGNTSKSPNARNATASFGLGDMRLIAYRTMLNPEKNRMANFQIGFGLKLPTGDYRYQDYFKKNDSTAILGPVDQSIQLGDGGTGIIFEAKGFWNATKQFSAYSDVYYLVNPREQNGVSTARGAAPSAAAVKNTSAFMSVPDQFMVRAGGAYSIKKLTVFGGLRVEGIPANDLVGGNKGFRRPGYVTALEPAASYKLNHVEIYLAVPVALQRNRTQSYADKMTTASTGTFTQGDAAFADYSVNFGVSISF